MEDYNPILREIAKVYVAILKKLEEVDHSDRTFKCKVTGKANDKYQVLYCGKTYKVSSSIPCEADDLVWVCAPCNRWNELFIVCKTK